MSGIDIANHSHAPPVEAATRELIHSDLENRFHQDIDMLRLLDMPSNQDAAWGSRVDSIERAFSQSAEMRRKIAVLQNIVNQEGHERERERSMYSPLCDILSWIVENDQRDEALGFARQWLIGPSAGPWMETEPGKDANNRKPDLVLIERAPEKAVEQDYRPFWRQVSATVAVKADPNDGPNKATVLVAAVAQTLDHMRVHLAFRPFQRWAFGLLLCGMDFYVVYLDRVGGFITPTQNLVKDLRLFIKVVLHMTKVMSRSQLGQDPEVQFGIKSRMQMREGLGPQTYPWDHEFPVYTFPAFSRSGRISTIGKPIFVVYGILGRGTSVWKVHSDDQDTEHIMKYSYRNVKRKSESAVYAAIQRVLPSIAGICKFVDGDDVPWDVNFQRTTISDLLKHGVPIINPRRKLLSHGLPQVHDRVVHRLLLSSSGESLSTFENVQHLTQVLTSALDAHAALVAKGILHRDISAGNILILKEDMKKEKRLPPRGLLADMELAKILPNHGSELSSLLPDSDEDITQPEFTCTPHFASSELLGAIRHETGSNFTASVKHDLQGFFWVTIWALLIKCETYEKASFTNATQEALQRWSKSHKARQQLITGLFGPHQISAIHDFRAVIFFPQNWPPESIFPKGLHEEIDNSRILWSRMTSAFESVVLKGFEITHKDVRSALDLGNVV